MITLKAKIRETKGRKNNSLRKQGFLPAVLYGPGIKNQSIEVKSADFKKAFEKAGESSLLNIEIDKKKFLVLIYEVKHHPITLEISHIDFYQPRLDKEVEATVPLIFEGTSSAVKDLGGTLIKEIQEIKVKALPQNLPHDIKVDISVLNEFKDEIKIKDLKLPEGVKAAKDSEEIVVLAVPPQKVEEELAKPIEEKVEDVEKIETKKEKPEEETAEAKTSAKEKPAAEEKK